MTLVIGAFTIGFILSLLSMGVWISFRIMRFCDITVDGSITLGASVAAVMLIHGGSPWPATLAATLAGGAAGFATGVLHTRFKIQQLLAGILVMTALYSVNLRVMGRSNVPLSDVENIATPVAKLLARGSGGADSLSLLGWPVPVQDAAMLITVLVLTALVALLIRFFLVTHLGTALRATGENPQMVRAQGVNNQSMLVFGLVCSNALIGMAGALLAQYQGFADVQMGIGMMVWGLASIIIGEALVARCTPGFALCGAIMGTILFRLLVAIALRWGLNPNDLKLVTAAFVFAALVLPDGLKYFARKRFKEGSHD
ncbi:MAG: ABC transporter permease [Kiritimatiellae bacterium]|nr:ABC transporter permease [Kiritimatiellia bacterium]